MYEFLYSEVPSHSIVNSRPDKDALYLLFLLIYSSIDIISSIVVEA